MKSTLDSILKAIVVSVLWGALATFGILLITSTYLAQSALGDMRVVTGLDAIRLQIGAFGYSGYLKTFFGMYSLIFITVFIGCVIHNKMVARIASQ